MTTIAPPAPSVSTATVVDLFARRVIEGGERAALRSHAAEGWTTTTWAEYGRTVDRISGGLATLGVVPGDRVAILSANRPEWHEADLATMTAGAVTVPVYPTSSSSQIGYILGHAGARVAFIENHDQLAKVLLKRDHLPELRHVVLFEGSDGLDDPFVLSWEELVGRNAPATPRLAAADDLATLVYTSGTTGPPKGAMISHANLAATIRSVTSVVPIGPADRFLSFLPLSHIAERVVSHFGQIASGGETWFARSLATVPEDLRASRPTIFFAVPRVWEKFHDAITENVNTLRGPQRRLVDRYLELAQEPRGVPYHALDLVVGRKLRRTLGLDQARILVSAAAPIHPELLRYFTGIGLPIAEVYGQTEDCGPTTMNPPGRIRIGTVGTALPGVDVRLADDGEILVRGPNVCRGYFNDPVATAALLDDDGWMRSGDVGRFDDHGYLQIVDRKKDLIITASGKNIAPQEIETRLRQEPFLSQAVVIGDGRPYLTALLTLDGDAVTRWAAEHGKLGDLEVLSADPDLLVEVQQAIDRANAERSRIEGIKRWRILPRDFTVAAGELTPTLKVRRNVVNQRYADVIAELYA